MLQVGVCVVHVVAQHSPVYARAQSPSSVKIMLHSKDCYVVPEQNNWLLHAGHIQS